MKIKLYFDKGNLGRLAVAMIFAAVLFWKIGFSVWALPVFGACYFLFKSLEVELSEKIPWVWTGLMIGASSIFTAYHVQYLLLDAELRAKITQPKMLLNILCCLVVFLAVQVFTNNTGLTCMISHIFLVSLAGINYFVYLFRGNEFIFSDLKSIQTGLSVAGNYEFVMDDRAGYVILISTLYVALIRKLHVSFKKSPVYLPSANGFDKPFAASKFEKGQLCTGKHICNLKLTKCISRKIDNDTSLW